MMMDKVSDRYLKAEVCKRDIEDRIIAFQQDQHQIENLQLGSMQAYKSVGGDLEQVAKRANEMNNKSKNDLYHTLKTKTFTFEDNDYTPRHLSAIDVYPNRNNHNLMNSTDFLTSKFNGSTYLPKAGPFSIARHQALFSSTDEIST